MCVIASCTKENKKDVDNQRTEHDDFVLHVLPYIGEGQGSVPVYDKDGEVIGWKITDMYD